MKAATKKQICERVQSGRVMLMVTYGTGPASWATTDGLPVTARCARELTGDLFEPGMPSGCLQSNEDGLFPGMPQTWRSL